MKWPALLSLHPDVELINAHNAARDYIVTQGEHFIGIKTLLQRSYK
jgi:hypothetical protein